MSKYSTALRSDRSFGNILSTVLSWNFVATLLALLFESLFYPGAAANQIASNFVDSFVYSNCIGTLLGFAVLGLAPRLADQRFPLNWILLTGIILSLTLTGTMAAGFTLMGLGLFAAGDYGWISSHRMALGFLIAGQFGVGAYLYESVRLKLKTTTLELREKELEGDRAQKLAVEATLSSLESRIHPHFLFNTLNSISSLIQEHPALAERMVERLAALLRFSLDSSQRNTILLGRELRIVVDYLEIEKARFGERLQYSVDIEEELETVLVPPFVMQTLVENSVKHAVSFSRKGGEIRLCVYAVNGRVNIDVSDDGPGFTYESIIAGHGLDNLRSRLATLFNKEAALCVSKTDGFMVVSVSIPNHHCQGINRYE